MEIIQIVIWGHKLHSHTHSYIHNGFYLGFKSLGYPVSWYDDSDDVSMVDFSRSLFITEHQVNKKIPLRTDCLYLSHYVDEGDYKGIPKENIIVLKVTLRDFRDDEKGTEYTLIKDGQKHEYQAKINGYQCLYMYWATDLLPNEIDVNIERIVEIQNMRTNAVNFIGSVTNIWYFFNQVCVQNGIPFRHYGATFDTLSNNNVSIEKNVELIQSSLISPALQADTQILETYIPCRIFKNISYGRMGMTNNIVVQELFDGQLIYDPDLIPLIQKGINFELLPDKKETVVKLMKHVRDNHTYLNRINTIQHFIHTYTSFILQPAV